MEISWKYTLATGSVESVRGLAFQLSSMGTGVIMLRIYIQSVLVCISWEIWKGRNDLLFENSPFMQEKVVMSAILAVKEIWLTKSELVIPPSFV